MKIVPDAIIKIEKWAGVIEPFAIMEEAWFRIKGIPMKYKNKSTAYYAASMIGVPLALDVNFPRNFAYVRVKIGSQDPALVPNSRIGAIKEGFYEFQFTREVIDPNTNPANYYAATIENSDDGVQQKSPKRQRTGWEGEETLNSISENVNNNNIGGGNSQATHRRDNITNSEKGKDVVIRILRNKSWHFSDYS
jgi:hypothetical protein